MYNKNNNKQIYSTKQIVWLAVLIAFVAIFQVFGSYIKIGATNLSLVLVPIVLGGVLLGVLSGFILGLVFSIIVFIMGITGQDGFTLILLQQAPIGTLITIFLKGIACGTIPALVYKIIKNKNIGVVVASILAPIMNTGLFIVCMLFMSGVISANFITDGSTVIYFLVIVCAGENFIIELIINIVLAPTISRVANIIRKNV